MKLAPERIKRIKQKMSNFYFCNLLSAALTSIATTENTANQFLLNGRAWLASCC
jgi:hypothetical protein